MKSLISIFVMLTSVHFSIYVYAAEKNQLKDHPSPYLAMHGNDPVEWQSWNKNIFEQARRENKLVFVSIGYFACHWCHVMQRESYQNEDIAKLINANFIPVKIDRELQPALDARLIEFVERTRGYAGWPLNVFITPEGYPLLGIVYLPPKDFTELLVNINQAWEEDSPGLKVTAETAAASFVKTDKSLGPDLDKQQIKAYMSSYIETSMQQADHLSGGFGEQSKFPLVPQVNLLLELYRREKNKTVGEFLQLTLNRMGSMGMYDHLRGGFYRYVVDPGWMIPHFEKMLYDNAQLAMLYLDAGKVFNNKNYTRIAYETLDFMLAELMSENKAMISSLSAIDNQNVEGGYYLWSDEDLKQILNTEEQQIMKMYWGMTHAPTLEAGHHPHISMSEVMLSKELDMGIDKIKKVIKQAKSKLKNYQKKRILPKDDKWLAAWNGLALKALVKAGAEKKRYLEAAKVLQNFIVSQLWNGKELKRAIADGRYLGDATLEDYAYVSEGLLAWADYSGKKQDLVMVSNMVNQAWERFYDEQGWLLSEDMIAGISSREAIVADGPMPSASASLIRVSAALAKRLNDKSLLIKTKRALNRGHKILKTDNFWYATHIRAMLEAVENN